MTRRKFFVTLRSGEASERPDVRRRRHPRPRQLPHHRREVVRPRQNRQTQARRRRSSREGDSSQRIRGFLSTGKLLNITQLWSSLVKEDDIASLFRWETG